MTDNPKAGNDNRPGETVKPDACLHCAIATAVNAWGDAYADGVPDGAMVLRQFAKCVAELIGQLPENRRVDVLGHFTLMVARRLRLSISDTAAEIDGTDSPPAVPGTKH